MGSQHQAHRADSGRSPRTISAAVGDGDEASFSELFNQCYGPVTAYVRRRSPDPGRVDDVVAEVFLVAWRRWAELSVMDPQLPWLYRVAANTLSNAGRSRNRHLRLVAEAEADPAGRHRAIEAGPGEDDASIVIEALAQLDQADRELLMLVAWEGLSHREVATVLDCSVNAVGLRLMRARNRLAEAMKGNDPDSLPDLSDDDGSSRSEPKAITS